MRDLVIVSLILWGINLLAPIESNSPAPWAPMRFMVGKWHGLAVAESGTGTVSRRYEFVLSGRFIHERNTTTYPPQAQNQKGEVHEHWSFFSYDKQRKTIVLRQFHQERFVNLYSLNPAALNPRKLVFESEHFENFSNSWRARETYEVMSDNEFIETFELAPPNKPFEVYSRSHFKRSH